MDKTIDVRTLRFVSVSEMKAKLSEQLRELRANEQRIVITVAGKPAAVLLAFDEFAPPLAAAPEQVISVEDWRKQRPERERVRDSILSLFEPDKLSRKGQKRYKRERVRGYRR